MQCCYHLMIIVLFITFLSYAKSHNSNHPRLISPNKPNKTKCFEDIVYDYPSDQLEDKGGILTSLMSGTMTGIIIGLTNATAEKSLLNGFSHMGFFSLAISWIIAGESRVALNDITKDILGSFDISYRSKILDQSSYIASWISYIALYKYR